MRRLSAVGMLVFGAALGQAQAPSLDVTQWRGPGRDGVLIGFAAPPVWPETLTRTWTLEIGTGYAMPLVVGGRVYQFSRIGENETMTALDVETGSVLWQRGYPASFTMHPAAVPHGPGPKSTPIYSDGRLFTIGMTGTITAWDATVGQPLWQRFGTGAAPQYTTHAFSPLVDDGRVIFHVGGHDAGALTAFDLDTGDTRWRWTGDGPAYASPVVATFGGVRQIVAPTQTKIVGVEAATGALLWERPLVHPFVSNAITPLVADETVIVAGAGPLFAFIVARRGSEWATERLWENADLPVQYTTPVLAGDMLFGLSARNAGQYFALDARTGQVLWTSEGRQAAHASVAYAGDLLISLQSNGELVVARHARTAFEPIRRYTVARSDTWAQPAISGRRIFVKDATSLTRWTLP